MANYGAPETLPDAHSAGEPSIGNSFKTGSSFYQAYLSTYKVNFNDAVSPPTATWTDVSAKAANGCVVGLDGLARPDRLHRRGHRPGVRVPAVRCELADLLHR